MKLNKIGIVVLLLIIIGCIIPIALNVNINWLYNLSFALLSGAILSFIISVTHYTIYLKESLEKLIILTHNFSTTSELAFNKYADSTEVKDLLKTITQIYLEIGELYDLNYALFASSFAFDLRRIKLKKIDEELKCAVVKVFKIKCFVEEFPTEVNTFLPKLYNDLKQISEIRPIYKDYLNLATKYFSSLHSLESDNAETFKHHMAEDYRLSLSQQKEEGKN